MCQELRVKVAARPLQEAGLTEPEYFLQNAILKLESGGVVVVENRRGCTEGKGDVGFKRMGGKRTGFGSH